MDQNKESLKSTNPIAGLPGAVFDKAWEVRWALKLTYVCLFMDIALMYVLHTTLLHLSGDMAMIWENIGRIFVCVMIFCLVVSLFIPVLARLTLILGTFLPWHWLESRREVSLLHNHVTYSALREHSLREGSEFLYKYWSSHYAEREEWREQRFQAGVLVFGLALLAIANARVGVYYDIPGLMSYVTTWFGVQGWLVMGLIVVCILYWAWWASEAFDQIYCPPLADKLRAEDDYKFRPRVRGDSDDDSTR